MSESHRSRERLDTPREERRTWRRRPHREDTFGTFAERFARFMGTARFLIYMTLFVVLWVVWNTTAPESLRFDKYAFIFLTLMLSLQASYAAPLILLAQNRQEARDRVIAEQDRQADARAHADMEFLAREVASLRMSVGEVATRDFVRSELRALLADLDERAGDLPEDRGADAGDRSRDGGERSAGHRATSHRDGGDASRPGTA
ncbi:DUF1003 domain-containing protein [Nocardioides sp. zg-536]|uniref:DUF1003 domain-containing protein n=1 Tax=Nocardioides faecalis TaxID=2803858 RepID=A0A939BWJ8_9ACTN|nr:DUF1003 domain-containing protein [Nocardioides faecalis]MBM9460707.1 DUF1003 domain-containing protein [Nocardioides faecalis]MBS4752646.1 DUF1003 domain-containing protein [Nocardioides faecalis]QVI57912.1 DUF1003 domain-containing protein [Nocardioides faecalis]